MKKRLSGTKCAGRNRRMQSPVITGIYSFCFAPLFPVLFSILCLRHFLLCGLSIAGIIIGNAQEISPALEQQVENSTLVSEEENEDDFIFQQLEELRRHPVNLNADELNILLELRLLGAVQLSNLISYRKLLGDITHLYELQAIPSWDPPTIYRLLPFITITKNSSAGEYLHERLGKGQQLLLLRGSQVMETSKGFGPGGSYTGSPYRLFFRYRYQYKNLLQYGITGDKDAGEMFFRGAQKTGFDFYSFHVFAREMGRIKSLALGDFTVSMGQGLIHWQGLAFKKGPDVLAVKRQSPVVRPYNSAGEFNFLRGGAITIRQGRTEASIFLSIRKLSTIINTEQDLRTISSISSSGYHRTPSETGNRNNASQFSTGASFRIETKSFHAGINSVYHRYSLPVQRRNEPYNLYSIAGNNWYNMSIDYSYTYRNMHVFGEAAIDRHLRSASVVGMIMSLHPQIDLSVLYRHISKSYQSVSGNAFTENSKPTDEEGLYMGLSLRPVDRLKLDAYADVYHFSWLKFRADAPSYGSDFAVQLTYTPSKRVEIYSRYRSETKGSNSSVQALAMNAVVQLPRENWRIHLQNVINPSITTRHRVEMLWYDNDGESMERGFLCYFDLLFKPLLQRYSAVGRLQFFETDGYHSRLYAYENDVLYSNSVPAVYDKGFRYYFTLQYDFSKRWSCWLRWSQTVFHGKNVIGSGQDEIMGNKRSELKWQWRYVF